MFILYEANVINDQLVVLLFDGLLSSVSRIWQRLHSEDQLGGIKSTYVYKFLEHQVNKVVSLIDVFIFKLAYLCILKFDFKRFTY